MQSASGAGSRCLPPIALPIGSTDQSLLFRHATAFCLRPVGWTTEAGRDRDGNVGWRQIAQCATGAEGPGLARLTRERALGDAP